MGFVLEKACFCMSLKTGTILLGVLNLIGSIIGACASLGILIFWVWYGEASNQSMKELQGLTDQLRELNNQLGGEDKGEPEAPPNAHSHLIIWYVVTGTIFLICALYIIIASLLIHGARKGRPGMLIPWLIHTTISMVLEIAVVIKYLVFAEFSMAISAGITLLIQAYLFLCVWSLRKHLQGESVMRVPTKPH